MASSAAPASATKPWLGLLARVVASNLPCAPPGTDLYPVDSEQHATFKAESVESSLKLWYGRTSTHQKSNAWNLEHFVKGAHGKSPAAMLAYLETQDWPQKSQQWVTTPGFHVSIQVITVEHFAGSHKGAPPAVDGSLAAKLDSFEAKLQGMKAEHDKDTERLADKLHQLTDYIYDREQHHHKNAALQFDHNNYVDDHLNLLKDEVAALRSDVVDLQKGGAKRRRLEGLACTCQHLPVSTGVWLERGASCFVKKGDAFFERFAQGWNHKLGYKLSFDKDGNRPCRQHASQPYVWHLCRACTAAA